MWGVNTMRITLYNVPEDYRHITKTLGAGVSFSGSPRGEIDMVAPTVTVNSSIVGAYNYAYIDTYGAYYWVQDITVERAGLSIVTMQRDPLTTFAQGVRACPAIAGRNAQQWDMWRGDSRFQLMQKKNIATIDLGSIGEGDAIIFGYVE